MKIIIFSIIFALIGGVAFSETHTIERIWWDDEVKGIAVKIEGPSRYSRFIFIFDIDEISDAVDFKTKIKARMLETDEPASIPPEPDMEDTPKFKALKALEGEEIEQKLLSGKKQIEMKGLEVRVTKSENANIINNSSVIAGFLPYFPMIIVVFVGLGLWKKAEVDKLKGG